MKNADMPAMPCEVMPSMAAIAKEKGCGFDAPTAMTFQGFTKREMMAMHMMAGFNANPTVEMNEHDMATLSVAYADALLYELERTCHKT